MSNPHRNVCEAVVPNDLCVGCGLCAGICPVQVLEMQFNDRGEYIPVEYKGGCLPKCELCLQTCPFVDQQDNEDTLANRAFSHTGNIQHKPEIGYYLDTYVGYSRVGDHRENGASGGLATWFLETLLSQKIVDYVVSVTSNSGNPEKLFQFAVFDSIEAVRKASKSSYYPVEVSDVIRKILSQDARYVVVGLPCVIKGIRLAMRNNRRLRQRIVVLVGLVCGQTKSRFFTEYLATLCGGEPSELQEVHFREKDSSRPASDYAHQFIWNKNGEIVTRKVFWSEGIKNIWTHDYFKINACNYCDDLFAETADVVFMDAWLPKYKKDYKGHSLVINRNDNLTHIWSEAMNSDKVSLETISPDMVILSQDGVLNQKRSILEYRLYLAKKNGKITLRKRVKPSSHLNFPEKTLTKLKIQAQALSISVWRQHQNVMLFEHSMNRIRTQINIIHFGLLIHQTIKKGRLKFVLKTLLTRVFKKNNQ